VRTIAIAYLAPAVLVACGGHITADKPSDAAIPDAALELESPDDGTCTAAGVLLQASNYNATCAVDSDCVAVGGFGDACHVCLDCPQAAISKAGEPQYNADIARVPASARPICGCPIPPDGPCCVVGVCQLGDLCSNPVPVGGAADDAQAIYSPEGPCTTSSDCGAEEACLFPIGDCLAMGRCLSPSSLGAVCSTAITYCGCNGTTVAGVCGSGYSYGPTADRHGPSVCDHTDAGDASAE
jgi:hypothetical protein